jgi:branched-chain amino acid transport system substrate-binding protein
MKHAALGQFETRYWSQDLKNEANQKFVGDYRKKYGGKTPSYYGAQSYDGILLIDSAVRAVKGNLADKKGMIAAMRKADFKSTRGPFKYGHNHFPIENFYLLKTVAGPTPTSDPVQEIAQTVFKDHKDAYGTACKMKW